MMSAANFSRNLAFCVIFWGGNRMQNHMAGRDWLMGLCSCAFARNQIELWTSPDDPPYTLKHEEFSAGCLASCGVGAEWMQQLWFGSQNVKIRCQRFDCCCVLLWKLHGRKMIQQKSHQICECNSSLAVLHSWMIRQIVQKRNMDKSFQRFQKKICHRFSQTHSTVGKQERSGKLVEARAECRFQTMVCVQRLWYNKKLQEWLGKSSSLAPPPLRKPTV